jgi:recombination protein RecA
MARNLSALRSQVEAALAGRIPAPFTYRDRKIAETVPAGIPEIDSLTGGLPRGGLTEICGTSCSGRTTLLISALAARTADAEACAFIDGRDAFDPHSAEAAGVRLKQVLWVRCRNIDQALRSTDLLLQGGGFGLVALDLGDIPAETVRYVPLNVWFRFRRAVEDTPTIFLVLEQEPHAKTCASLVLRMKTEEARWSQAIEQDRATLFAGGDAARQADARACRERLRVPFPGVFATGQEPQACLFRGSLLRAEMAHSRQQPAGGINGTGVYGGSAFARRANESTMFETKTQWSYDGAPKCRASR